MDKKWSYAELSKAAKEVGGPEEYAIILQKSGFQKGVMVMVPICIAGCFFTYKKGTQIASFVKEKLGIVSKADVENAKEQLRKTEEVTGEN